MFHVLQLYFIFALAVEIRQRTYLDPYISAEPYGYLPGRSYPRFCEIPVDGNSSYVVDLERKANVELVKEILKYGDINKYLLYTRKNLDRPQYLTINDAKSLNQSNFNPWIPTIVLIHGWKGNPYQNFGLLVRKVLLKKSDVNVIVVSWQRIAILDYATAVYSVPSVGKNLGRFLQFLNAVSKTPFSLMHLAGHSLGAHVAGNAGREVGGILARITGLDPAGPFWYLNPYGLRAKDANYVEAIHTNALGLGIEGLVADADFFPNGGSMQPGCILPTCSHSRSYELFAASVEYNYLIANRCENFAQMTLDRCRGQQFPMGNDDVNKKGSGIYRLKTGKTYPYQTMNSMHLSSIEYK